MARLGGKVALITGAARGQGRSHAEALAREGADIIAVDICRQIESVPYAMASSQDLEVTADLVRATGRDIVIVEADVRRLAELKAAVAAGVEHFGSLDIVVANAGIYGWPTDEWSDDPLRDWQDTIDVDLTGVWNTLRVVRPIMVEQGTGGAIVVISSTNGLKGLGVDSAAGHAYTAAKHGLVGLMRLFANLLAEHNIRVNSVHPTGVSTPMVHNSVMEKFFTSDLAPSNLTNLMPVELVEPEDVSRAVMYLASDDGRYITGVTLPVDAGITAK